MTTGSPGDATARWLDDACRLSRHVPRVDLALTHAEESCRLNVRAWARRGAYGAWAELLGDLHRRGARLRGTATG